MFGDTSRFIFLFLVFAPHELSTRKVHSGRREKSNEIVGDLITSLRNDANLDLSMDEEYEDLRAELLAYHSALSSLTGSVIDPGTVPPEIAQAVAMEPGNAETADMNYRRSMKTTPCWQLGGICVNFKLCEGHRSLTEVPGCKNKLEVCCFTWNNFERKDLADRGIKNLAYPWSNSHAFGGKGLVESYVSSIELSKKKKAKKAMRDQNKKQKKHKKHDVKKQVVPIVVVLKSDKK